MAVKNLNETTEIRELRKVMALAPTADSLDDIWNAATVAADGVAFMIQGREIVKIKNTTVGAATWTLKSVIDDLNRLGDVGPYSLAAGESCTILINPVGFKDANGRALIVVSDVGVQISVSRVPSQL